MRILAIIIFFFQVYLVNGQGLPIVFHKKLSTWGTEASTYETNKISFSKDERFLAAGTSDGNLLIWDVNTGKIHKNLSSSISIYDIIFSPDGKFLIAVGSIKFNKGIEIWNAKNFKLIKAITYDTTRKSESQKELPNVILSVYLTPDGKYCITADDDGTLKVWSTNNWKLVSTLDSKGSNWCITGTSNGKQILTSGRDGLVWVWDFDKGKLSFRNSFKVSNNEITSISVSPDNLSFTTNSADTLKTTLLKNGSTDKVLLINDSLDFFVTSVHFDPHGEYLSSGHALNNLKIWSIKTGKLLFDLQGDSNNPDQNEYGGFIFVEVQFSQSGEYLVLSNDVGFIYLYKST